MSRKIAELTEETLGDYKIIKVQSKIHQLVKDYAKEKGMPLWKAIEKLVRLGLQHERVPVTKLLE